MAPEPEDSICWTGVMESGPALGLLMTQVKSSIVRGWMWGER